MNNSDIFLMLLLFTLVVFILCFIIYKMEKRIQILETNSQGVITILKAIQEGKEFHIVMDYEEENL